MVEQPNRDSPATSSAQLLDYLRSGAKPPSAWKVGVEHEKLLVRPDGRPVPFSGASGIAELLERLTMHGYEPRTEDGHIISLERRGDRITLEPGGQFELSAAARPTAAECASVVREHVGELRQVAEPLDIVPIAGGLRPFGSLAEVPWSTKRRYLMMRVELPRRGRLAREMMQRTAAVHINLDFSDESDAVEKLRAALAVTSVVTAMAASSPISGGRANGFRSRRAAVWLRTDESRSGVLPFMFAPGAGLPEYVGWALDVPVLFVKRGAAWVSTHGMTFRQLMQEGVGGQPATMSDWELHLSSLFPEVRLRRHLEMRGTDAGPLPIVAAVAALWRGLLDDAEARRATLRLTSAMTVAERLELRRVVPRFGLQAVVGDWRVAALATELLAIARRGLAALPAGDQDATLLDAMQELVQQGLCPADLMLRDLEDAAGVPTLLVQRWAL